MTQDKLVSAALDITSTPGGLALRSQGLRSVHRAATRDLLVNAAERVFAHNGYWTTTIDQITADAGASRATFYLHFRTKADVLEDLLARSADAFTDLYARLDSVLLAANRCGIRAWLLESMYLWPTTENHLRPVFEAAAADPEIHRRLFPEGLPGIRDITRVLVHSGIESDPVRASESAAVFFAPLYHFLRAHLRGEDFSRERAAGLITTTWIALLRAQNEPETTASTASA